MTITGIDARTTPEDFSGLPRVLPVALAEIQLGDAATAPRSADEPLDDSCRNDLISIDGEPVAVRLIGSRGDALARSELQMESCEPIRLTPGSHRIDAAGGAQTGFDIDRIVLDSAADSPASVAPLDPDTTIDEQAATSLELTVGASDGPTWLILEQSWNAGWTATVDGEDLGVPVLINGFANAWLLPASTSSRTIDVRLGTAADGDHCPVALADRRRHRSRTGRRTATTERRARTSPPDVGSRAWHSESVWALRSSCSPARSWRSPPAHSRQRPLDGAGCPWSL